MTTQTSSTQHVITKPPFQLSLLHPKYWGVWFGFGLLAFIVNVLPYRALLLLGRSLGALGALDALDTLLGNITRNPL